jgi:MFS family permease
MEEAMGEPTSSDRASQERSDETRRNPRLAAITSMAGSVLEYYDYMLYATAAALVFPHVFFPDSDPAAGVLLSLATYGVSYLARPVGAVVLGTIGDRIGRRALLRLTIWLMGAATLAVGLLPTYRQVGTAAPVLLVVLRILQGFSTAAEAPAGATLALEHAESHRRAFTASFTASGVQGGQALASLAFIPVAALPEDDLYSWGWRIPFLASALVFAFSYVVRRLVPETPEFDQAQKTRQVSRVPVVDLFRSNATGVFRVAVACCFAVPSSLASVFGLSYATSPEVGVSRQTMLWGVAIANVVAMLVLPIWGHLADRVGRKPVWIGGALCSALAFWGYLAAIDTHRTGLILPVMVVFLGIVYSAPNAVSSSMFPEWFPTGTRVLGSALGNQIGLLVFGFAPTIAQAIVGGTPSHWGGVVILVSVLILCASAAVMSAPETHRLPTHALGSRQKPATAGSGEPANAVKLP